MYSVCVMKQFLERGVIVIHILEEQGLHEGPVISLHEVLVLGLITCEEVGVVSRVHLFSGEVRSVTTAHKVADEVQEEVSGD